MKLSRVGIDLGKSSFQVCGMDQHGRVVLERKFTRRRLERFLGELAPCTVAMEGCGGAHHWARRAESHGHRARLVSPQFVKPYVKSNKNDARDAEAICEAAGRTTMRFAPLKTVEQQALQHEHRARFAGGDGTWPRNRMAKCGPATLGAPCRAPGRRKARREGTGAIARAEVPKHGRVGGATRDRGPRRGSAPHYAARPRRSGGPALPRRDRDGPPPRNAPGPARN